MKRKILLVSILVIITVFAFASCKDKPLDGQIPVYQGMIISSSLEVAQEPKLTTFVGKVDLLDGNGNQHQNGHHHGDTTDKNQDIDEENPFGEIAPTTEEIAGSTLEIVGASREMYYAEKNQDIYITVKVSNPDKYEIMSFTLNGEKYSNYMFENGSDLENLILKLNVGNNAGIKEYTIDAIKYINGTEIKDVLIEGNKTVKAGIRTDDMVYASISERIVTLTSISYTVNIADSYNLIEKSGGYSKAILYDGTTILQSKDLIVGSQEISFENLTPNTLYVDCIASYYDALHEEGFALNILFEKADYTNAIVLFDNIEITKESVSYSFSWDSSIETPIITSQELFLDNAKVKDWVEATTTIENLLSNREYSIKANYNNLKGITEKIEMSFVTYAKAIPVINIEDVDSTQSVVSFAISTTDIDSVGELTAISLYKGDELITYLTELTQREFTDLLSNNTYTIRATCSYDLNDGNGTQTIIETSATTTDAKAIPVINIEDVDSTQSVVSFAISTTDIDSVGELTAISLYKSDELITYLTDLTQREFSGLEYNTLYQIRATYTFDVNDGVEDQEKVANYQFWTAPNLSFKSASCANTSAVSKGEIIYFEASVDNPNEVSFSRVKINNEYYNVSTGTTYSSIIVNMVVEEQFEGGNTELTVTEIVGTLNGVERKIDISENNTASVFVNGELEVLSLSIIDENGREPEFLFEGETYFYLVELGNRTGYSIDSVTIATGGEGLIYSKYHSAFDTIDNNTLVIRKYFGVGWQSIEITSIDYSNESLGEKTKEIVDITNKYLCLNDKTPIVIATAEGLKDMDDWGYYVLERDIDLIGTSGHEWSDPGDFHGYFDGQGHKIVNMNFAGTVENQDFNWGLFKIAEGMVSNLIVSGRLLLTITNGTALTGGIAATQPYWYDSLELHIKNVGYNVNVSVNNEARSNFDGIVEDSFWRKSNTYYANLNGMTYQKESIKKIIDLVQPFWDETIWDFESIGDLGVPDAKVRYDIIYNVDGGINNIDNLLIYTSRSDDIVLFEPKKIGYIFEGWYDNEELAGESANTITAGASGGIELYASWELCDNHTLNGDCICTKCGLETHNEGEDEEGYCAKCHKLLSITNAMLKYGYARDGRHYIWFGEYPQTIKEESVIVGDTPDSRGYYLGSDGYYYAKITATPDCSGYKFSTDATVASGMVYYFKVEPIKWRILSESNGEALILCESIIANKRYNEYYAGLKDEVYANNYEESEIRAWLNNEFYSAAFTTLQQELILVTNVDNSVSSTGSDPNPYACANTSDKIFLPSYREITNTAYGFSNSATRGRLASDYSRATGAFMETDSSFYGNGWWWLRSPYYDYSYYARDINYDGSISDYSSVSNTGCGVVPALKIKLS